MIVKCLRVNSWQKEEKRFRNNQNFGVTGIQIPRSIVNNDVISTSNDTTYLLSKSQRNMYPIHLFQLD